ncbi:MAG: DUF2812 domain-containing protein [Filifactoraceae bacterium]
MVDMKRKIKFFTVADYNEEADWLRKQHNDGWKLKKMTAPCFFTFEKCQSEDVIYQLDYENEKVTEEYVQIFKDYGWEYCGSCIGWNYFRKPVREMENEKEKEIFSDAQSKASMIEKVLKTRILPLVIIFCTCIIPQLTILRIDNIWMTGFFGLFAVIYIYIFLHVGLKLIKIKREMGK